MSECYLGEIRMFAGNYAPENWALCNGQLLSISQNETLFTLLGTTYGGDGQATFALPDLRGRIPISQGNSYLIGQFAGTEEVTLIASQLPAHTHAALSQSAAGNSQDTTNNYWAGAPNTSYSPTTTGLTNMNPTAISSVGGSQPHDNMMPFLTISFIIALVGIYPTQN